MRSINQRLKELTDKLGDENIFKSVGLGNEINFYVFDYDPEDEYVIRDYLYNYLITKNENILIFDIYDIIIDYLKERVFREKFVFKNIKFDKNIPYYLVIIDEENNEIFKKIRFYIDRINIDYWKR